jgi:hypothetical protein
MTTHQERRQRNRRQQERRRKGTAAGVKSLMAWGAACLAVGLIAGSAYWGLQEWMARSEKPVTLAPEAVADYLHAVIEAQRTVYTTNVVDALQDKGVLAEEHWKQQKALPLPAQMILDGGRLVAEKGVGIKYRLASLTPIYVWNAPSTDFERKGLDAVGKNPDKPFTGFVRVGRDRFFQAVYADRAVSQTCVQCHNAHLNSPKKDYQLNDVMGGIIITIPVGDK